jgi:hypothetical protein
MNVSGHLFDSLREKVAAAIEGSTAPHSHPAEVVSITA